MDEEKVRIVTGNNLAHALAWLGFHYVKDGDNYIFNRSRNFDQAFRDLHGLRAYYKPVEDSKWKTKQES